MKKLLSILLATLMVIAVFPVAVSQNVNAVETERIAYLDSTTTVAAGEVGNANKPFKTLKDAYNALCPEGGTVMIVAPYESGSVSGLKVHYGEIVITAQNKSEGYLNFANGGATTFKCGGPVTFENLRLGHNGDLYICGNYNHITMGDGITCEKPLGTVATAGNSRVAVLGGTLNVAAQHNAKVTIKSGAYRAVAGGGRNGVTGNYIDESSETTKMKVHNGTYQITVTGGEINFLFGTNWSASSEKFLVGGQAYIYMSGGTVNTLHTGSQTAKSAAILHSVLVYTGGYAKTICSSRTIGQVTLVYGGDVKLNPDVVSTASAQITAETADVLVNGNNKSKIAPVAKMNIIPLATGNDPVVYLSKSGSIYGNGSESSPVRYLHQAIAAVSNGGTIKFLTDYTVDTMETNNYLEFFEPAHSGKIVIDGNSHKFNGLAAKTGHQITVAENKFAKDYGLATYVLNGDTTFKNITFVTPRDLNFAANFNSLTMNNVETEVTDANFVYRIFGGIYNYTAYYAYYGGTTSFNSNYARHSDKSPVITVDSGKYNCIAGFSKFLDDKTTEAVPFAGTSTINIKGTATVANVYPGPIESPNASGAAAVVNISESARISGGIFTGGNAVGKGSISGNLTVNVSGNADVGRYGTIDTCDGTRYYNINTDYATYLKVVNHYANDADAENIVVSTDIEHLAFTLPDFDIGVSDEVNNLLKLRARYSIDDKFFDNEDYNIVEMGVLVKLASVDEAVTYIKGASGSYYAPVTIGGEPSAENYSGNIAKSVAYVQNETDSTKSAVANYMYDGQNPVVFTAPVVDIKLANGETGFTFVPYVVLHNTDKSDYQVFCGEESSASVFEIAEAILNDTNSSVSDKELAQSIKTAISGGYGE